DAAVAEIRQALRGEDAVQLEVLAAGERLRELGQLRAVVAENADEHRGRVAGALEQAEVRAEGGGAGDLLEGDQAALVDELRERNGRDVLAERAVRGDVVGAAGGERGDARRGRRRRRGGAARGERADLQRADRTRAVAEP